MEYPTSIQQWLPWPPNLSNIAQLYSNPPATKKPKTMANLPHDIFLDILLKLPVKSLLRLRCVSKPWRDIIDDPRFATMHLSSAAAANNEEAGAGLVICSSRTLRKRDLISLLLLEEEDGKNLKSTLLAELKGSFYNKYVLHSSCNGLLCFGGPCGSHGGTRTGFLCNPFLNKDVIRLPPPPMAYYMGFYGLGFDPSTSKYKIVNVFYKLRDDMHNGEVKAQVHTVGTGGFWRMVRENPPNALYGRPVSVNGALHWEPNRRNNKFGKTIVSFDMADEVFYLTHHPGFHLFRLVDLGGVLGIVDLSSPLHVDIWLLKGGKDHEWVKEYRINIEAPCGWNANEQVEVMGMWRHGHEILIKSFEAYYSYNVKRDELSYVQIRGLNSEARVIGFRGSLVSPSVL